MEKKMIIGSDASGFNLKEAVKAHLVELGYEVTDVGTQSLDAPVAFNEVAGNLAKAVSEEKFERGIVMCGTGMGVSLIANKYHGVYAGLCEALYAVNRARVFNNINVLAMGGFYVAPRTGMAMADAFLEHKLGDGYEDWEGFYEFHKLGYDELEHFDYEAYKANGFQLPNPGNAPLGPEPLGHAY